MANQGEPLPNHAVQQHIRHAGIPGHGDRHHLLDAARALMLLGAVAAVSTTVGADAGPQVFLGLVTWLLGVCLLSLVPVAGRLFPQADRLAGAATASTSAVLRRLFTPWD